MTMATPSDFIVDGYDQARSRIEPEIVAAVHAEYAEQLHKATLFGRLWLKWQMRREIERRIADKAPPDALY
jgi:hypothetical protein